MDFAESPVLQEFTKATDIRLSLRRTKTLQGHLMQLARQDPTVTRRVSTLAGLWMLPSCFVDVLYNWEKIL